MNIIEAAKSGKPSRRKGDKAWCYKIPEVYHVDHTAVCIRTDSFFADDWEIRDNTIELTEFCFWGILDEIEPSIVISADGTHVHAYSRADLAMFAEKLGLK